MHLYLLYHIDQLLLGFGYPAYVISIRDYVKVLVCEILYRIHYENIKKCWRRYHTLYYSFFCFRFILSQLYFQVFVYKFQHPQLLFIYYVFLLYFSVQLFSIHIVVCTREIKQKYIRFNIILAL